MNPYHRLIKGAGRAIALVTLIYLIASTFQPESWGFAAYLSGFLAWIYVDSAGWGED